MDFSESYQCSLLPSYSPDGLLLATAVEYRLAVREAESLKVIQLYSCLDKIHSIEWSPDSRYVLCGLYERSVIQVWSVDDPEWTCKIDEGPAGIKHCRWLPDGTSVLLVADFCIRMTVWSLVERCCGYLPGPKFTNKGIATGQLSDVLVVLERKDCKDWISVYSSRSSPAAISSSSSSSGSAWLQQHRFQLGTLDASHIALTADETLVAVADTCLNYKVQVYALDGSLQGSYSAYDDALGVRGISWSPDSQLLAVGSYDQVARLLNSMTWQPLLECHHGSPIDSPLNVVVYQEVEELRAALAPLPASKPPGKREARAKFIIANLPAAVTVVAPTPKKPNPKLGVSQMCWSADGAYLATINENMPQAVWVWAAQEGELAAVLLLLGGVKALAWAPVGGGSLAVATGGGRLYLWSVNGASVVHVPLQGFQVHKLAWSPHGSSCVVMDREAYCCVYTAPPAES